MSEERDKAEGKRHNARPAFRRAAAVIAVFCFILAIVFGWVEMEGQWVAMVVFLFVGFVMAVIAATGSWPPKR